MIMTSAMKEFKKTYSKLITKLVRTQSNIEQGAFAKSYLSSWVANVPREKDGREGSMNTFCCLFC